MRWARRYLIWTAGIGLLVCAGTVSALLAAGPRAGGAGTSIAATSTASTATATSPTTTSSASSVLALSGHGWGHGLGLSQWGAYGYAQHGWRYDQILAHYYSGTTLGPANVSTVRVLLRLSAKVTLSSVVGWTVRDATGASVALPAASMVLTPKLAVAQLKTLAPPFTFTGRQPVVVNGQPYRGKIVVSLVGKQLEIVDVVGLEAYLKGVVPSEMPSTWSPEALKAQSVAARSYALANLTKDRDFDLYGDTRSQVYGGLDAESTAASAAVDATKGEVVLYKGKVATTYFFSTSGGKTASASETTGVNVPYLVSVADPYDTASPYHAWGPVLFDAATVAKQLKIDAPISDLRVESGPSGRAKTVTVVSANDLQTTLTGSQLRAQLELRSTWFSPVLLQLLPTTKTITYGGALSLTGFARNAAALSLESKTATQSWASAGELLLGGSGAFSMIVKPVVATQYRLALDSVRAGLAKIAVAPRVDATATTSGVEGTSKPVVPGAPVQLQQQSGPTWATVATTTTDASGTW
ncbi:MAG: SpoIID/LytB domain-containing protein, partial [Actinobacteria bacterium]|nr:SpoIID/LytB domain-containing protein [Actinomycetota bacterium]